MEDQENKIKTNALLEAAGNENSIMAVVRQAKEGMETVLDVADAIIEGADGVKVPKRTMTIERRQMQPERPEKPRRAESPRRSHVFHSSDAMADYLRLYAKTNACVVLADVKNEIIVAVLDENASEGRELVAMRPAIHPKLLPWMEIIDETVSVHDLAAMIMQNRRTIIEPDAKEMAVLFHNLRMSKAITIDDGKGARAVNGLTVETTIQGKKESKFVELPQSIKLFTPIYVGTDPVEFEIDLLVHAQGESGGPQVDVTSSELTDARVDAFEQMLRELKQVTEGVVTGFGELNYGVWDYLPQK